MGITEGKINLYENYLRNKQLNINFENTKGEFL